MQTKHLKSSFVFAKADGSCPEKCSCSKNLTVINCSRRKLEAIPKNIPSSATILYLGHNRITTIEQDSFANLKMLRDLYINNNRIGFIDEGAFKGLASLNLLSLTSNLLSEVKVEVLQDLASVEKLYLTMNDIYKMPDFASVPMNNLVYLTVDNNKLQNVDLCHERSGMIFGKLGTLVLSNNLLGSLKVGDFACISPKSLTKIILSRNKIASIDDNAFSSFDQLQSISLSYNDNFSWQTLMNFTSSVSNCTKLNSIDLSGVLVRTDLVLNSTTFSKLAKCPIRYLLLLKSDKVSKVKFGTFDHFPKLETLDLSNGVIAEFEDDLTNLKKLKDLRLQRNRLRFSSVERLSLPSLESLNLAENINQELTEKMFTGFPKLKTLILRSCKIDKIFNNAFAGLSYLRELDLSMNDIGGNNIPSKLFNSCPKLKKIDVSTNKMTSISTEHTLFEGLYQLQELDLSNNNCHNMSEGLFKDQTDLKNLNLAGNRLGQYFSAIQRNSHLFSSLQNLKKLELQRNDISYIPDELFYGLGSSAIINLSSNSLTVVKPFLYKNTNVLECLDMSRNHLSHLSPEDLLGIPSKTSLNISFNPFDCSCDLRSFMYWLRNLNISYMDSKLADIKNCKCSSPVSLAQKPLLEFDPDSIIAFCNWIYILIGSLLILFVVALLTGLALFRYRWHIRFYCFQLRQRKKFKRHHGTIYGSIPANVEKYVYDITISYHEGDENWVLGKLIPKLEQWKKGITDQNVPDDDDDPIEGFLFAVGYNSEFGKNSFLQVCEAMMESKKIIHCISKKYLNSHKCLEEINAAVFSRHQLEVDTMGNQGLFLIILEPQVDLILPATIRPLRASNKFCEWSEDKMRQTLFWNDLQKAMQICSRKAGETWQSEE